MTLPLTGVRVLDLTRVWSGPVATRMLADFGAEVINVVGRITVMGADISPEAAEILGVFPDNEIGERPWDRTSSGNDFTRNKLNLTLELNTGKGTEIFKQLVKVSDVVIENFSPRVMPNFGLDYDALRAINPGIIMCSMPGYGLTGPYRDYVSYGTNLDPASGLASLMGYPGDEAHMSGNAYPDPAAGLHAAGAVMTALYHRRRTGQGQHIDLAQSESATFVIGEAILGHALNGRVPRPDGNRHPHHAPHGCYPCRGEDKWVTISVVSENQWQALKEAMGNPAPTADQRFATAAGRVQHQDELDALIASWTRSYTHEQVMHLLQSRGVPSGAVWNAAELFTDPQLNARGFYWEIDHPLVGPKPYCGNPVRLSAAPDLPRRPAPCLGEHNHYVLAEILGMSAEAIAALEDEGVIGTEPIDA